MILAISKYPFQGDIRQRQLCFPANAQIRIDPKSHQPEESSSSGGWIKGAYAGHVGWLPLSYVEIQQPFPTASSDHDHNPADYSTGFAGRGLGAAGAGPTVLVSPQQVDSESSTTTTITTPPTGLNTSPLSPTSVATLPSIVESSDDSDGFDTSKVMGGNDWADGKELNGQRNYGEIAPPRFTSTESQEPFSSTSSHTSTHKKKMGIMAKTHALGLLRNKKGWPHGRPNKKIAAQQTKAEPAVEEEWVAAPQVYVTEEGGPRKAKTWKQRVLRMNE